MSNSPSPSTDRQFIDVHPLLNDPGATSDSNKLRQTPTVKFRGGNASGVDGGSGGGRDADRQSRPALGRQVSLEAGLAVLNMEKKGPRSGGGGGNSKEEQRVLSRNGKSLGGYRETSAAPPPPSKGDFSIFRTKSTLTKQNSLLPIRRPENELNVNSTDGAGGGRENGSSNKSVPAGRYFAALLGPELDQVRDSEDILLPKDQLWPFLLRFPIGCFGVCLGLGSQAILWGNLAKSPVMEFLKVSPAINVGLWLLALASLLFVSVTYALKCIFYFEAIRREYSHPVRVNFFFAPWIAAMFLAIAAPPSFAPPQLHPSIWCAFIAPVFLLELKIYGQWLSGGKRRLSKVANPSSHLSVVGNFVGAVLAAKVGWAEAGKFLWAVGLGHYLVVFVTLYQRLPTSETLPKELHPVYSMFIATPSAASLAWAAVYGEFDAVARTLFFIALFLYISLVVRINFFRGFKFSIAWWSYTFPMTTASLATIKYAEAMPSLFTKGLTLVLSLVSTTMVSLLIVSTLLHAFVWRSLFPNDLAIAIAKNRKGGSIMGGGGGGARPPTAGKERRAARRSYDNIKRWAKQALGEGPSAINKSSSTEKEENSKH